MEACSSSPSGPTGAYQIIGVSPQIQPSAGIPGVRFVVTQQTNKTRSKKFFSGKADVDTRNFSTHFPEDGEIRPSQIELHRMEVCNCYREMIKVFDSSCNGRESRRESESVARDSGGFRG
jgi:hypothetical protein